MNKIYAYILSMAFIGFGNIEAKSPPIWECSQKNIIRRVQKVQDRLDEIEMLMNKLDYLTQNDKNAQQCIDLIIEEIKDINDIMEKGKTRNFK